MKVIEWKQIKGFDGYFINVEGQIKSTRSFKGTQEKTLGYSSGNIGQVCNGKRKSAYGYIWGYVNE